MKSTKICVFPDTLPQDDILFPLVHAFEQVVYLRPVENDIPDLKNASVFLDYAIAENLIEFCCTAPLGDNRERFLHLVDDLQHRPDDYAGQLTNLSLAGLGRHGEQESKSTIINTLLKQNGIDDKQQEQRETVLWQARLVLALGEIFDKDQADLQKNLAQIAAKQEGLLDELREDDQQPFSFTKELMGRTAQTDKQFRLRLKAWSRMQALGSMSLESSILITANPDALDLLIEKYENDHQTKLHSFLQLPLPVKGENISIEQLTAFKKAAAEIFSRLTSFLQNPGSADSQQKAQLLKEWTALLDTHCPAADLKRCQLSLYALPDTSPQKIFLETFGRDEDEVQLNPLPTSSPETTTLIGIIQ